MKNIDSKIFALILALAMALSFAACSVGNNPTQGGSDISKTTPDKEGLKALAPIASEMVQDYDYIEIGKMFSGAGFTNVSTVEVFDIDPDSDDSIYTNIVTIGGVSDFKNAEAFPADSAISVVCHRPYEKYTLSVHVDFVQNLLFSKYPYMLG